MGSDNNNCPRFERYLFCICEAGICDLRPLKNDPHHRLFYKCLAPKCSRGKNNFFKYEDKIDNNDVFIDVPNCGCNGSRCSVAREKKPGPNAGKIVFTCTVKEGEGACKYKVYQDELLVTQQLDPSASNTYDDISDAEIIDLVMPNEISDQRRDYGSPVVNMPKHFQRCEASWKMKQLQCQEMELGESSTAPRKRSRNGEYKGASPLLDSSPDLNAGNAINSGKTTSETETPLRPENFLALNSNTWEHAKSRVNYVASPNITSNIPGSGSSIQSQTDKRNNAKVQRINPSVPSVSDNFIAEPNSNTYGPAAKLMQSELLTFLKKMEAKDHESMLGKANSLFSAFDVLFIDYRQFKEQVMEFINSAKLLHEVQESIPQNGSVQKLFNRFDSEKKKLDEINSAHAKAVETVENSKEHVKVLKENISSTKSWLVSAEDNLLYSEEELRGMENQLEQICKEKEVLKEKCDNALQEYEEYMELREVTEAERYMAINAFDRARMSLTG